MAIKKWKVLATKTKVGKNGKKQGVYAQCSDGETRTFLNPHGKGEKYAAELKHKKRFTNLGEPKVDKKGHTLWLTKTGAAWRSGYLQAQKDAAKAYKAKHRQSARSASKSKKSNTARGGKR